MKKSLVCLAVLGSCAAANAQSSLTLHGTVDTAVNRVSGSLTSKSQVVSGANSSSKLIIRGNEDLGGGMYATFWLESAVASDSGVGTTTNTNNQTSGNGPAAAGGQGLTFNRRSIVGLGGDWGAVHLGREWSPTYDVYAKYDIFAAVGVGVGLNFTASFNPNLVRVSNDVAYITPKFLGGFTANIQHWRGENPSGTATSDDGTGSGVRLSYENGPFNAIAHYARTNFASGDGVYRAVGAIYDPGPYKVMFNVNSDKLGTLKNSGFNLGGLYRVAGGDIKAGYSVFRSNAAGNPEGRKLAVGYVHNLSKRTAVYTTFAHIKNKNGSALAIAGSTTGANQSSRGLDIGLRHHF